jgi:hypothetical protein
LALPVATRALAGRAQWTSIDLSSPLATVPPTTIGLNASVCDSSTTDAAATNGAAGNPPTDAGLLASTSNISGIVASLRQRFTEVTATSRSL